jgi:CxxC-x17-CxxC domain-containing protein
VNLDKYNAYIRLMINGITSKPFSMQTIPPAPIEDSRRDIAIKVSRERYGRRRKVVEDKIARWSGVVFQAAATAAPARQEEGRERRAKVAASPLKNLPPLAKVDEELEDVAAAPVVEEIKDLASLLATPPPSNERNAKDTAKTSTSITCARCGKQADVPFVPEPGRPVYCRECFAIVKNEQKMERLRLPTDQAGLPSTAPARIVPEHSVAISPPRTQTRPAPPPPRAPARQSPPPLPRA